MMESFSKCLRREINQVLITFKILRKQNQIVVRTFARANNRVSVPPATRRHESLVADDRADARFLHSFVKINGPEHVSVVSQRAGLHTVFCTSNRERT